MPALHFYENSTCQKSVNEVKLVKYESKNAQVQTWKFIWPWRPVQSTKGHLISKANPKLLIWTKNQRKYFLISALASKSGQIKKIYDKYEINSNKPGLYQASLFNK